MIFVTEYSVRECTLELASKNRILILIHANPDGDCVGSGLALAMMLRKVGKIVKLVCPHSLPTRLEFICENVPGDVLYFNRDVEKVFKPDCIISVDIAAPELLGKLQNCYSEIIDICVDHHIVNTLTAKKSLIKPDVSSCGEMVFEIGRELSKFYKENLLTKQVCNMLYTAIALDTGSFMYGNVTANTFLYASLLKKAGANTEDISRLLFGTKTFSQYKLTGLAISKTKLLCNNKIACCLILNSEMKNCGVKSEDTDCLTQMFREIKGVEVSVFIREYVDSTNNEHYIKASLRSNTDINVAKVCEFFGGGGHTKAAGCTIKGKTIEEAENVIISKIVDLYPEMCKN